jgi:hypothetical protein
MNRGERSALRKLRVDRATSESNANEPEGSHLPRLARCARPLGVRRSSARIASASLLTLAAIGGIATATERQAKADPLRLRADAYAQTDSPVGMLVVRGDDRLRPWIDAEAVAWLGVTDAPNVTGDVQTLTVRVRDPGGRGEVRVGRFLESAGAIRPLHIDGVRALGRAAEMGTTLELFAGSPVVPRFGARQFDYALGGRAGQQIGTWLTFGLAYVMRRNDGQLLDHEIGPDLMIAPVRWFDMAARAAFDLVHTGPTDALVSIGLRTGDLRVELFGTHRSAGRMLPATSLFSVLGDHPATTSGGTLKLRAAPRLDLLATGATIYQNDDADGSHLGAYATARANLALDDAWAGNVGIELRRWSVFNAKWWGARLIASVPVPGQLRLSTELEIVRFDDVPDTAPTTSSNKFRPWALVAASYRGFPRWDFAGAVEYTRTRDDRNEYHAMARATFAFERTK